MFLLDTNVVSELRRPRPHPAVVAWLNGIPDRDLHLSAVTLGELQSGIEKIRDRDPLKAGEIEAWLEQVAQTYNVLPMQGATFRCWARLMHHRSNTYLEDAMIAATAQMHGLVVVTRNIRDFDLFNVRTLNPFQP